MSSSHETLVEGNRWFWGGGYLGISPQHRLEKPLLFLVTFFFFLGACYDRGASFFFLWGSPLWDLSWTSLSQKLIYEKNKGATGRMENPTWPRYCEIVVVPEGVRKRTQGYQLRLETAPVLLCRFLIIGVELWEARGDRKGEGGVRAWGWGEAHRVRFTPALLLCSLLDLYLWNVQGTFS